MKTVTELGGPTAVSRIVGLSVPTVHGWKKVPEKYCPAIERAHEGRVTADEIRSDVTWLRVKDKTWPHPKGRPVLDFALAEPKAEQGA